MADTDDSTTDTEQEAPGVEPSADHSADEVADEQEVAAAEPTTDEPTTSEQAEAEAEQPEPEPARPAEVGQAEDAFSLFGAQFSSPEPTAVIARPRRRATRPAGAVDPDAVPPAPAIPAFVSFVAPAEAAPPPRRRSRRPEPEPEGQLEEPDDQATADAGEPEDASPRARRSRSRRRPAAVEQPVETVDEDADPDLEVIDVVDDADDDEDHEDGAPSGSRRRRRGRRGRGRGRTGEDAGADEDRDENAADTEGDADTDADTDDGEGDDNEGDEAEGSSGSSTRRRRRRRRRGSEDRSDDADDDRPERAGRDGRLTSDDDVRGVAGSTRLEAKRQRRREGRDTGRRRAPILTEAEFLARREAVDRAMVIRQRGERTQIAVLEDDVLVEHYVTQAQATSFAGNVYLGRVQNVLPSMEAAFVDIGKGRNAVLYAGEVNWEAAGLSGKQRSIETALKSGDKVLVQVTKDPIGHKGARLTQQINLPGRFLVYVPGGSMTGISRKLPDTERTRLKDILKKIVPEDAGVIIRTAAEGASEEELTRDVARLQAQWDVIQKKAESTSTAPSLLYGEPDLAIRVIRDVFNEDFKELVVQGDDAWDTVEAYVAHVSPELSGRLTRYTGEGDVFRDKRIDEQLMKALDRKVWLPSGGSLVIDRTEAMTVVDVNTGKFTGSGGNLEQTVTRNNMEAAEEIVRQLRLRDIGGIIVIDFIDMVLESNRDLVLRRLTECLGRDRTKHQVAEVTSLGLVQMTRKRVGQGLLEVFSEPCEHCRGRGVVVHLDPVDDKRRGGNGHSHGPAQGGGNGNGGNGGSGNGGGGRRDEKPREDRADSAPAAGPAGDEATEEPSGEGGGRSSRRNRGRRNRGQAGEERAADDAAVLAAAGDEAEPAPDDVPSTGEAVEQAGEAAFLPAAEAGTITDDVVHGEPTSDSAVSPVAEETPGMDETTDQPTDGPTDESPAAPDASEAQLLPAAEAGTITDEVVHGDPAPGDAPADEGQAPAGRPRRRRGASRPAGPPA